MLNYGSGVMIIFYFYYGFFESPGARQSKVLRPSHTCMSFCIDGIQHSGYVMRQTLIKLFYDARPIYYANFATEEFRKYRKELLSRQTIHNYQDPRFELVPSHCLN